MIRKSALLLLALGMLFVFPQAAGAAQTSATTETYDIPATMDWRKGNQSSIACYAFGLATWPEQENAISWEVTYKWNGDPRSKTTSPPFDDERLNTAQFGNATPPAGSHWIVIGEGYKAGAPGFPTPDCSDSLAFQQAAISDVKVTVTVEVEEKKKCRAITERDRRMERKLHSARKGKRREKRQTRSANNRVKRAERRVENLEDSGNAKKLAQARQEQQAAQQAARIQQRELAEANKIYSQQVVKTKKNLNTKVIELIRTDREFKELQKRREDAKSKPKAKKLTKQLKAKKKKIARIEGQLPGTCPISD